MIFRRSHETFTRRMGKQYNASSHRADCGGRCVDAVRHVEGARTVYRVCAVGELARTEMFFVFMLILGNNILPMSSGGSPGDVTPPTYTPMLDFSDGRNSMYAPIIQGI